MERTGYGENWVLLCKTLIQFSADGWAVFPPYSLAWSSPVLESAGSMIWLKSSKMTHANASASQDCCCQRPLPHNRPLLTCLQDQRLPNTQRQVSLGLLWDHCSFPLGPGAYKVLFVPCKRLFPQSCGNSVIKFCWPSKSDFLGIPSPFTRSSSWEVWCGA